MADDLVKALAKSRGPLSAAPIERSKYLAEAIANLNDRSQNIQSYPELGTRLAARGLMEWDKRSTEKKAQEAQAQESADFAKLMGQILGGGQTQGAGLPPIVNGTAPQQPGAPQPMDDAMASYAKFPSAVDQVRSPTNPNAMSMFGAGGQPQPQAAQPSAAQQPPQPQAPPNPQVAQIQALLSSPDPRAQAMGMKMAEQLMNPEMTVVNTAAGPYRVAQSGPEGKVASIPEKPQLFNMGESIVSVGPDGQPKVLFQEPKTGKTQWRPATPEEIEDFGLPAGTSLAIDEKTGAPRVLTKQRQYTEFAGKAAEFGHRMAGAGPQIDQMEALPDFDANRVWNKAAAASHQTSKNYRTAMGEWLAALLRKDTGAAVTPQEFEFYGSMYFPVPGDTPQQVEMKRGARKRAYEGVVAASQGASQEWFPKDFEEAPPPGPSPTPKPNPGGAAPPLRDLQPGVSVVNGRTYLGGDPRTPEAWGPRQ